ncbi:slipin family protein [Gordonibacter massiliensis (ex Traore et al. 2017)]|uniref:Slipin family protein n=1 Tax=Gordonibacter massiliensis (ex Traore et al. 2017) TaxID=1841863 RepID=A0A842JHT9_9ACTN|nr:slipin family protein [Gordonibacter massiliensis (ex Traore et al. 2017)]MBC2890051.1 slipin family protein [Gordonibacter massiliensis (ex Traore et al. 2017)]
MRSNKASAQKQNSHGVVAETQVLETDRTASKAGALIFAMALFAIAFALVLGLWQLVCGTLDAVSVAVALIVGWLAISTVHIAQQWEKFVVLRFGKLNRISGPGLVFTLPIVEHCALSVDMRMRSVPFGAKETLTADLIPLDIDAVLYWMVWDAEKACMEINNYSLAVQLAAQTALRDAIGRSGVAEITIRRNQLDKELTQVLDEKTSQWGISVLSVEIRDIVVPESLQETMSLEAQAEQRKKARIILMEAEQTISEMAKEVGEAYDENDNALAIRRMHLLYESVRDTGGTVVVPSSFSEGFGDVFPDDVSKILEK